MCVDETFVSRDRRWSLVMVQSAFLAVWEDSKTVKATASGDALTLL